MIEVYDIEAIKKEAWPKLDPLDSKFQDTFPTTFMLLNSTRIRYLLVNN